MGIKFPPGFFKDTKPVALISVDDEYISLRLCQEFLKKDLRVILFSNKDVYNKNSNNPENANYYFLNNKSRSRLLKIPRVNYLVHLIGPNKKSYYGESSILESLEKDTVETRSLLRLSLRSGAKFLLISQGNLESWRGAKLTGRRKTYLEDSQKLAEALVEEYGNLGCDTRIVRLGDLYGPGLDITKPDLLSTAVRACVYGVREQIDEGAHFLYPTYIEDIFSNLIKSLLSSGTRGKVIFVAGEISTLREFLEKAREISGNQLNLATKVNEYKNREVGNKLEEGVIYWRTQTALEDGLRKTINWLKENQIQIKTPKLIDKQEQKGVSSFLSTLKAKFSQKIKSEVKSQENGIFKESYKESDFWRRLSSETRREKNKNKTRTFFISVVFVIPLLLFIVFPFATFSFGVLSLYMAGKNLESLKTKEAYSWSRQSQFWLNISNDLFSSWRKIPLMGQTGEDLSKTSDLLRTVGGIGVDASILLQNLTLFKIEMPADRLENLSNEISLDLARLEEKIGFLEAESTENNYILSRLERKTGLSLSESRKVIKAAADLFPYVGDIFGTTTKRTYLVLFQNNNELRATGGFIGSYGLVTFDRGAIINFDIKDVYATDGQLKGHVEPPWQIRDYLGEANWFLRDSNWSPDFPTSAARAIWFIEKETNQKVDGVVALDLEFVKNLLAQTGPLKIDDLGEIVDKNNLYLKTQEKSEKNFFPGSQSKKDFLTALGLKLKDLLLAEDQYNLLAFLKTAAISLETRNLAFYSLDKAIGLRLSNNDWDGHIKETFCDRGKDICVSDYLMVVDSNLGVNKSNYYLDRSFSLETTIEGEVLVRKLRITYKNSSVAGTWPGGDYKNYLRLYLQPGSSVSFFKVRDGVLEKTVTQDIYLENNKEVVGGLVQVPAGQTREVIFQWQTNYRENLKGKGIYKLYWQKQMGTLTDRITVTVNTPTNNLQTVYPPSVLTTGGSLRYNGNLQHDLRLSASW